MKKAQILSAIALAFALGLTVVAPVANVNAFTVADSENNVRGSASKAEVETAVEAVKNTYPVYGNVIALNNLLTGKDAIVAADDLEADSTVATHADLAVKIVSELTDNFATIDTTKVYDSDVFTAQIAAAATAARKAENYSLVANYLQAIEDKDSVALRKAIAAINTKFDKGILCNDDVTIENYNTTPAGNTIDSQVQAAVSNYTDLKDLVTAVNTAEEASTKYTKNFNALSEALRADGILTANGRTALAMVLAVDNPTIADLLNIKNNTTVTGVNGTAPATPYTNTLSNWTAVETAVKATSGARDFAGEYNYNLIINIAKALQTAVPMPDKTAPQIAEQLVGYVAPETPDDTTTTTIESADGSVSVKGELQAGLVVEAKEAEEKDEMFKKAFGDKKFFVYDIKIKGQNGYVTTFDKDVTVTVKVPENINGAKAGIYYINAEGSASKIASTYNAEAKTLTFTTNHFSYYAIVEDNGVNVSDSGVLAAADGTASSTVAIVAGIATALTAAGAGVVAYRNARRASKEA